MAKSFNKVLAVAIVFGLAAGLTACASQGPTDNPIRRNLTWDRYVGGDDMARSCAAGQPARYRLVYNARQNDQQRSYDISAQPDGGAMMEARVLGRGYLNTILLSDPLKPWNGEQALYRLTPAEFTQLKAAITATGFEAPAPEGTFLRGDSFYWAASACRDGQFHFHAWVWPSPEFDRMAVPLLRALAPFDKTAEKPIEPYEVPLPPYSSYLSQGGNQPNAIPHRYIVGKNGLRYSQGILFN
ncbi:MAG: hypothetical protein OJJ21_07360 [Ferrovibrio sp.]|uniref:hypothetical protein n=1 Tax=Ferrovibrio sp. TaxID=1917215 RepID=UPI002612E882|nr:hypothetical protein [Ferrovibrio sp.]MCW0233399.1 hypothetical protein [Ferrovibrio sp.]